MNEIETYINNFTGEIKERLNIIRDIICKLAPEATERICMRMPTYDLNEKWLVHFAGFDKHIGFYPQPDGIIAFQDKLTAYKTTKGGIQFPLDKPLPVDLIHEIVKFRVNEQNKSGSVGRCKSEIIVPQELNIVLSRDSEANAFFISLSDGYKRSYCDWVGGAKAESTRQTRAEKALIMLQRKQKTLKI